MNILNVIHSLRVGGIEKLLITTSNELSKNNRVYLCIISGLYSEELLRELNRDVEVIFLEKKNMFRRVNYMRQIRNIIKEKKIEVFHIHQPEMMTYFVPVLALQTKVKKIVTIHDTGKMDRIGSLNRFFLKMVMDSVIAISEAVKEEAISYGISTNKIYRVYNAINLEAFAIIEREKEGTKKQIVIGNVARVLPEKKGQDLLIRALSILQRDGYDVVCRLAGAEVGKGKIDELKQMACSLSVEDKVFFHGNVDDIPAFLSGIDIFVLPSRYEGFGISLIEAMATGLPCISSDAPGVNEILVDKAFGEKFKTNDANDLAIKIEHVIDHLPDYDSKIIRDYVHRTFSIDRMCFELVNVYTK